MFKWIILEFLFFPSNGNPFVVHKLETFATGRNNVEDDVIQSNGVHTSEGKFNVGKHSPLNKRLVM